MLKKILKFLGYSILLILIIALIFGLIYRKKIYRVHQVNHLFDKERILDNFRNMDKLVNTTTVHKSDQPYIFAKGNPIEIPSTFSFKGEEINTQEYLSYIQNTGFLILLNDTIVHEEYRHGHQPSTQHISWSVAKSYISALMGIAIEEGHIKSIEDTVTDYLPELKNTGYDGVRIKDVLQMSTGVGFNEDYGDFNSDINRMGRTVAFGTSLDKFSATLKNEKKPGTHNHYVSINTHVLSMIIRATTQKTITEYLEEKVWKKIGCEFDSKWIVDDFNAEFALGGLNAALRDYAKIGRLFLNNGNWNGEQIVPAQWVKDSTTPDAPHLMPGADNPLSTSTFGYGYQWWIPENPMDDFTAAGVYNQYVYVNKKAKMVIAFNSSNYHFNEENLYSKEKCVALFQTIAKGIIEKENIPE